MGGVVNIITKRPLNSLSVSANLFYGTYNTMGGSLNLMGRQLGQFGTWFCKILKAFTGDSAIIL